MRILLATYALAFQNPGGGEQLLLALEKALKARGHTVDFHDPWKGEPTDYDVIHYFSTLQNRFWGLAKECSPQTPLVVSPILYLGPGLRATFCVLRDRAVDTFGHLPDLWLAATEAEAHAIRLRYGGDRQVRILPNGVDEKFAHGDPALFRHWLRENSSLRGDTNFILHVGRFHPVKNQLHLIEAARRAGTPAVFIGGADLGETSYHESCLAAGQGHAVFVGPLDHEDPLLASAYAAATVFALPSQFETFGISALEAGCAGASLVLSERMLEKEIFARFQAEWISPESPAELASALQRALKRGRRPARVELAREFFWPAIAERLEGFYRDLLEGQNSAKLK